MGHFKCPSKVVISKDLRHVYSIGPLNGIYKWTFYGDVSMPDNIEYFCEQIEDPNAKKIVEEEEPDEDAMFQ